MGKYEVTRGQWAAVMGKPRPEGDEAKLPQTGVSWYEAQEFLRVCNEWLLKHKKLPVGVDGTSGVLRLPTEGEWEYAARGGSMEAGLERGGASAEAAAYAGKLDEYEWHRGNAGGRLRPVGQKRANAFGLYDMLGNAREMVGDAYQVVPGWGPVGGIVLRGGDVWSEPGELTISRRGELSWNAKGEEAGRIGFRVMIGLAEAGGLNEKLVPRHEDAGMEALNVGNVLKASGAASAAVGDTGKLMADRVEAPIPGGTGLMGFRAVRVGRNGEGAVSYSGSDSLEAGGHHAEGEWKVWVSGSCRDGKGWLYYLGEKEVSREQWRKVMGVSGGNEASAANAGGNDGAMPIADVSWAEVQTFLARYNEWLRNNAAAARLPVSNCGEPVVVRLPTEVEWEYAARGGAMVDPAQFGADRWYPLEQSDRYESAFRGGERTVYATGSRKPNPLGLYDMLGNVAEMTQGWFRAAPGAGRVGGVCVRGGSAVNDTPDTLRASMRYERRLYDAQTGAPARSASVGFRLAFGAPWVASPGPGTAARITSQNSQAGWEEDSILALLAGAAVGGQIGFKSKRQSKVGFRRMATRAFSTVAIGLIVYATLALTEWRLPVWRWLCAVDNTLVDLGPPLWMVTFAYGLLFGIVALLFVQIGVGIGRGGIHVFRLGFQASRVGTARLWAVSGKAWTKFQRISEISRERFLAMRRFGFQASRFATIRLGVVWKNAAAEFRRKSKIVKECDFAFTVPEILNSAPLADRGSRLMAVIIDYVTYFAILRTLALLSSGTNGVMEALRVVCLLLVGTGCLALVIYQIYLLATRGETIGKRVMKIRIVSYTDGTNPGFGRAALVRAILPLGIAIVPFVGLIFSLVNTLTIFGSERRCIHDRLADTKVVSLRSLKLGSAGSALPWPFLGLVKDVAMGFGALSAEMCRYGHRAFQNGGVALEWSSKTAKRERARSLVVLESISPRGSLRGVMASEGASSNRRSLTRVLFLWLAGTLVIFGAFKVGVRKFGGQRALQATDGKAAAAYSPGPGSASIVTKEHSSSDQKTFENSLGMKFVSVPVTRRSNDRQKIFFSVWDTRVQDYEVYVSETSRQHETPAFEQGPTHPVVMVSWDDAVAFCDWLTLKERQIGKISREAEYRLPSDQEWSSAIGISGQEDAVTTPKEKNGGIDGYPWGAEWPPPKNAGNYGTSLKVDQFTNTSPVGSFMPNRYGIYDISGNVWQWCQDWYVPGSRVLRGASWTDDKAIYLRSSYRNYGQPTNRYADFGFRCVLADSVGHGETPALGALTAAAKPRSNSPTPTTPAPASPPNAPAEVARLVGDPALASIAKPFANSLGMKFVPVPITGGQNESKKILVSVWDTRVQDYDVFVSETSRPHEKPWFEQGPTHPVVMVSWEDAEAFCNWLTHKERQIGKISGEAKYRLPSDHEWSCAMGIGGSENAAEIPKEKDGKIGGYPWGSAWPPPENAGNYAVSLRVDRFQNTSPVGSFRANRYGLYDMSGNVWQWCQDWYDPRSQKYRVLRGGSWHDLVEICLRSSCRGDVYPADRSDINGFRCVLVVSGG